LVLSSAAQGMGIIVAQGMGIMDHQLPTATPSLPTVTPLRSMGMGTLITDRGTIPATGTLVITVEGAITDTAGRSGQACSLTRARPQYMRKA